MTDLSEADLAEALSSAKTVGEACVRYMDLCEARVGTAMPPEVRPVIADAFFAGVAVTSLMVARAGPLSPASLLSLKTILMDSIANREAISNTGVPVDSRATH